MLNLTQIQAIRDVVSLPIDVFMRANRIDLLEQCHAPRGDVTALESLRQFEARLHDEPEALRRHAIMLREIFLGVNPIQYGRRAAGTPLRLDAVGPAPDWDEVANEIEQFIDLHKEIKQQYDDMMREGIDQERRHSIIELTRVRGASLTAPQITNLISSLSIMCDGILESDIDSDIVERCISENSSLGLSVAAIRDSVAGDNTLTYIDGQPYSFEQIFINANFRGVPEEIAEDWRSFIYFIQGRPNDFSEEVCLRLGQYPNYNPYLFAELIRFNQELPPLVSASTRAYLLQLREAYLGQSFLNSTFEGFEDRDEARRNIEIERGVITDSEFDQIELEVTRYFYRVGTLPFSLERLGHDEVDQAVIQGIIT
ncbi:MAG: hypothetical protein K0U23_02395, partial [Gammaproteobacteria bacterium]|nr:hypothetical protein [Gammaproteobacteria bacterium]